jgi:hypothetical protein
MQGRRCSIDLVNAAGAGVTSELYGRSPEEFAAATPEQRLLWVAGLPSNDDATEDLSEDWSLDPWLYQV